MRVTVWRNQTGKFVVMDAERNLWSRWTEAENLEEAMKTFRYSIAGMPALEHVPSGHPPYKGKFPPEFYEVLPGKEA